MAEQRLAAASLAGLAAVAALLVISAAPVDAQSTPVVQVLAVDASDYPDVTVDLSLPEVVAARSPGPSAFSVAGGTVRAATRLDPRLLTVGVVIDDTRGIAPQVVTSETGASLELLRGLDRGTSALLAAASGARSGPSSNLAAVTGGLRDVGRRPIADAAAFARATRIAAARVGVDGRRGALVVLASDRTVLSAADAASIGRLLAAHDVRAQVVVLGTRVNPGLSALARATGGTAVAVPAAAYLRAVDRVTGPLADQYRLAVEMRGGGPRQLRVMLGRQSFLATVPIPAPPTTLAAAPNAPASGPTSAPAPTVAASPAPAGAAAGSTGVAGELSPPGKDRKVLVAAVAAIVLAFVVGGAGVVLLRRARRTGPASSAAAPAARRDEARDARPVATTVVVGLGSADAAGDHRVPPPAPAESAVAEDLQAGAAVEDPAAAPEADGPAAPAEEVVDVAAPDETAAAEALDADDAPVETATAEALDADVLDADDAAGAELAGAAEAAAVAGGADDDEVDLTELDALDEPELSDAPAWDDDGFGPLTLAAWFEEWWPSLAPLSPAVRARDERLARTHILPALGEVPLRQLSEATLEAWAAQLAGSNGTRLAPAEVHRTIQLLDACLEGAVEDGLVQENLASHLTLPAGGASRRVLTDDELWRLTDAVDPPYRAFVLLAGFCGLRLGELLALHWSAIDLEGRRIDISEALLEGGGVLRIGRPKSNAAVRSLRLPSFVVAELDRLAEMGTEPDELVFPSPQGHLLRPTSFRRNCWLPAVETAGLAPLAIHELRPTAVAIWISEGASPEQVAKLAGHSSAAVVVELYGDLFPDGDDRLLAALERRESGRQRAQSDRR